MGAPLYISTLVQLFYSVGVPLLISFISLTHLSLHFFYYFFFLSMLGIESASPDVRRRLSSALDENERLDNDLVGQLVRQAQMKSPATSPRKSQTTIEVK